MTTETATTITLPYLPPAVLSHNGRGWTRSGVSRSGKRYYASERAEAFAQLRRDAVLLLISQPPDGWPWPGAVVDVVWRYAGPTPDPTNVQERLAAVLDAAQAARLVENDRTVQWGRVELERVPRAEQGCTITLRRSE